MAVYLLAMIYSITSQQIYNRGEFRNNTHDDECRRACYVEILRELSTEVETVGEAGVGGVRYDIASTPAETNVEAESALSCW